MRSRGKKVSRGGAIRAPPVADVGHRNGNVFSPWEIPLVAGHSPEDCGPWSARPFVGMVIVFDENVNRTREKVEKL
jgi:hypothetical protein